jgi:hypothetical protein
MRATCFEAVPWSWRESLQTEAKDVARRARSCLPQASRWPYSGFRVNHVCA